MDPVGVGQGGDDGVAGLVVHPQEGEVGVAGAQRLTAAEVDHVAPGVAVGVGSIGEADDEGGDAGGGGDVEHDDVAGAQQVAHLQLQTGAGHIDGDRRARAGPARPADRAEGGHPVVAAAVLALLQAGRETTSMASERRSSWLRATHNVPSTVAEITSLDPGPNSASPTGSASRMVHRSGCCWSICPTAMSPTFGTRTTTLVPNANGDTSRPPSLNRPQWLIAAAP
ncbi:MAG: hypothetical protein R2755_03710 [Acidimicrobiales bacterium]